MPVVVSRPAKAALSLVLVVGVLASGAVAGAAVDDSKTFTVDVRGLTVGSSPDVFAGDADASIRIRLTNTGQSQSLNSANVTVPAPYSVVSAVADTVPGGPALELRNLGIAPNGVRDFLVTVDVRACAPLSPAPFAVTAKQSNDYNGTGNDFYLAQPSDRQVDVVGSCSLAFVTQPSDAERGAVITGAPFLPSGAPASVEVRDAGSTGRATHSTAGVSLAALNPSLPAPVLGGTTSAAAIAGLAQFNPGPTLGISAFGYTLVASSTGITSSPASESFAIVDDRVNCPAGQPCGQAANASQGGQSVSASFGTGGTGTDLLVSLGAADVPSFACADYPRPAGTLVSQFVFTEDDGDDRTGTMTTVIPNATKPLNSYQACWAAPYPFQTRSGVPAVVQGVKPGGTEPLYVGVLPDCAKKGTPVLPCVSGRSYDRQTRSARVTASTTGSDPWRY